MIITDRLLELLRFGGIGLTCFALGLAVLTGLHELVGVNYLLAYVTSFIATNVAGYLLNARFTFAGEPVSRAGAARYMAVNAALLCANTLALKLLVERLHVWYLMGAILIAISNMPISFFAHRLITYRLGTRQTVYL